MTLSVEYQREIKRLTEEGYSTGDIANLLDCARSTVRRHQAKMGLTNVVNNQGPRPQVPYRSMRILLALLEGEKPADVARKFNVSPQRVSEIRTAALAVGFRMPELN